jgi:hypothetical protein
MPHAFITLFIYSCWHQSTFKVIWELLCYFAPRTIVNTCWLQIKPQISPNKFTHKGWNSAWNINLIPSRRPTAGPLHPILASIIFDSHPKSKPGLSFGCAYLKSLSLQSKKKTLLLTDRVQACDATDWRGPALDPHSESHSIRMPFLDQGCDLWDGAWFCWGLK